ncbi:MAG: Fic family protein [Flavobacteriaceae bacterium]|nr:MAG: Fic family protein [Flavobacteriaceae bacterium]
MKQSSRMLKQIQLLKERYCRLAPDKQSLIKLINETEIAEQVYNSNAIENSTLTLDETEKILMRIDLDRFINERELFEAKNLARVVEYINQKATEKGLALDTILLLHKMLISNIRDDIAGRFRNEDEWVRVGNYIAPNPIEILGLLKEMLVQYQTKDADNIIRRIARLHLTFEHIHPFVDGNGRIGRVINNYALLRDNYVPINIKFINRKEYYDAFQEFDQQKTTTIMEEIVGKALCQSFHKRLAYLEGKKIIALSDYAKQEKISHSNLLNKANRQTIEAFLEKGVWKIGV